ncbi:MAG: MCE family protein [Bdellovibrionaceae bacterium]|nr:MCE family protein [Bdellovibrionales bacterium]MCB9083415.1 MCE family protein [Pseudobdellovibrionaceae bacterium]
MKVKLNRFERAAGIFLLAAVVGSIAVTVGVAIKKGWFSRKVLYETSLDNAEGIHPGTVVQVSGLRAGEVSDVELVSSDRVLVRFRILEKFSRRVRTDSRIQVVRPFIIGEKVLDLSIGSDQTEVAEGGIIPSKPSMDLMDLVSGKRMNDFLSSFSGMVDSLKVLSSAFADPKRTEALIKTLDRMEPLVVNLNRMAKEMTKMTVTLNRDDRFESMVVGMTDLTREMKVILPEMAKEAPQMGKQMGQLIASLSTLAKEFEKLAPAIQEVAPDLPRTSRRAVEALDEAVVLLKAMQKSIFLRGNVEDVREEESKSRKPAGGEKAK